MSYPETLHMETPDQKDGPVKAKYYELEDLVYLQLGNDIYRYHHSGNWNRVQAEREDEIAKKLKFDASEIPYNEIKGWALGHELPVPPEKPEIAD